MEQIQTPQPSSAQDTAQSWWQWLKDQFNCAECDFINLAIYALVGFIVGLLFRYYGRHIVFLAITIIVALFVLQYIGTVSLNIQTLSSYLGAPPVNSLAELGSYYLEWARVHVAFCIMMLIGFFLGARAG